LQLLIAANELGLELLLEYTTKYFIKTHKDYIKKETIKILKLIYSNEENFKELKEICLNNICNSGESLFQSSEFESLEKTILLNIISKDDFDVDEIIIWENILKWGLAKHPEINNIHYVKLWTKQNFVDLGYTLKDFILLIRFIDISSQRFRYKIMPYKKLFPKDLWETLLDYYLDPDKRQSLNLLPSRNPNTIISSNQDYTLVFASLIDGRNPAYASLRDVKYKFKLLYRSSRDGLNAAIFHEKCDNIKKTLVIGKIQNTEQIIGGYNPLDWNGDEYKNATESFIFNINNSVVRFSYVKENFYAICCLSAGLPSFCYFSFCANGTIDVDTNPITYDDIDIVDGSRYELEVFQVIDNSL
jgi:hypothetical protein